MKHVLDHLSSNQSEQLDAQCEQHGAYTSRAIRLPLTRKNSVIWSHCPACNQETEADRELQEQHEQQQRWRVQANIPKRFEGCTFDSFKAKSSAQKQMLAQVQAFTKSFPEHLTTGAGLILVGPPGTGKTHLALALAQHLLGKHTLRYETASRLIRQIRNTWGHHDRSEQSVFEALCRVDCLILDEIGARYDSDGERVILFDVIDERYLALKPTILISNLDPEKLKASLGLRSYDRLRETSQLLTFHWDSYRANLALSKQRAG